jgi:tungstate transport system substrate-binding protein
MTVRFVAALVAIVAFAASASARPRASGTVILSTTSSMLDSGLLDILVPVFERHTGYTVKTISVGTGQALTLAARGEADVTLAHAPALEKKYVAEGRMLNRRLVMYNDFVIAGSERDPARVRGHTSAVAALRKIAAAGARFVSRGDKSGTHLLEQALWREAGLAPAAPWYIESGQGMGQTLTLADDRGAYTLTDRATLLAFARRSSLVVMVEGDRLLLNVYSVMEVNPANGPRVNAAGGKAFADFMLAPATQDMIRVFGVDTYGRALFVPIAGKRDEDL